MTADVLIVGAGSVGLPLAYYLARRRVKVACVDMFASAGQGSNKTAIGGIRATHTDPNKIRVASRSLEIVSNWQADTGDDVGWRRGGYVFLSHSDETSAAFRSNLTVQQAAGLNVRWAEPDEIIALFPGLNARGLRGGTYSPEDGSASPLLLADSLFRRSRARGVAFRFDTRIVSAEKVGDRVGAMISNTGERFSAGLYVNAAGGWARELAAMCGARDIAVIPDSHEGGITEPVARLFEPMVVDLRADGYAANFYFYQNVEGQVVFCCTPERPVVGTDTRSTSGFLPYLARRIVDLYPRLARLKVRRTWRGTYPMTPDGSPIVEYAPGAENVLHAAGMCGQGFMLGIGLGEILAQHVSTGRGAEGILDGWSSARSFAKAEALK